MKNLGFQEKNQKNITVQIHLIRFAVHGEACIFSCNCREKESFFWGLKNSERKKFIFEFQNFFQKIQTVLWKGIFGFFMYLFIYKRIWKIINEKNIFYLMKKKILF